MFIGHFAVGFASKRWAPRTNFGVLLLAPLLADVIWPVLILAGVEHARLVPNANPFLVLRLDDIPWSHSLLMDLVWAGLFGALVLRGADGRRGAVVVAVGVLSHWVLDWITHTPDMALWPGGPPLGLGLWNSVPGTMIVESAMFVAGVWLYARATRPRNRVGSLALWALVGLLSLSYAAQPFSPPPPSITAVGVAALVMTVLILFWAVWIDRHREAVA